MKLTGTLTIHEKDPRTGKLRFVSRDRNTIAAAGFAELVQFLVGNAASGPSHLAVGTDATAAAESQTALVAEVARGQLTNRTASGKKAVYVYTMPASLGAGNTLREAGLFNAPTGGAMFNRVVLATPYEKTSTNLPVFTFEIALN